MTESFTKLLEHAFSQGPAHEANQLIHDIRQEVVDRFGTAANYEVLLDGRGFDYLRQTVAPRLAFYLRSKRFSVHSCEPVFLSMFYGDTLYFVAAPDFYRHIQAAGGYSDEAFSSLAATWEETGRAAIAALPSAEPPDA